MPTENKPENGTVKFPNIEVTLVGEDGNAFAIMGRVTNAMREGGCTPEDIKEYQKAAMSGDYNHLLIVSTQTVNVS